MLRNWPILLALLLLIPNSDAQSFLPKIQDIQVGFQPYGKQRLNFRCKVGLWTPIYVTLSGNGDGLPQEIGTDDQPSTYLQFTTKDSDSLDTQYRIPFSLDKGANRTIVGYTKPGLANTSVDVSVHFRGKQIAVDSVPFVTQDLGQHFYLTLGPEFESLHSSMLKMARKNDEDQSTTAPRYAGLVSSVDRLPSEWFGYDAVDLLMVSTSNKKFLDGLLADESRLKAIATWVRRGGRLAMGVDWKNQQLVSNLLMNAAWSPPLPTFLTNGKAETVDRLYAVEQWTQSGRRQPFRTDRPIPIARFADNPKIPWRVLAATDDGQPIIAQFPYGLGAITVFAFDFHQPEFRNWIGAEDFFKTAVNRLSPRVNLHREEDAKAQGRVSGDQATDMTTQIYNSLDDFDVPRVSFGWVAFLIAVYILVVGPLDYLLLKRVFKRLEWTWITFPVSVVLVGGLLVFTASSMKEDKRRINQVDVVDIDLRSQLDADWRPKHAFAIGRTWFSLLSPQNHNYTIGVEPNINRWWGPQNAGKSHVASPVSWLGRPEKYGPGAMSRAANLTLFRRPYRYAPNATGLVGVPIPVSSTKSFTASWETPLPRLPLDVDLTYYLKKDLILSGAVKNNLPVDLQDVWLLYRSYCFPLPGTWKAGEKRTIQLELRDRQGLRNWPQLGGTLSKHGELSLGNAETIKLMLFHEDIDAGGRKQNHMFRRLDMSWRLPSEQKSEEDPYLRDAIIYARLAPRRGDEAVVTTDAKNPLPSRIWFGELPTPGRRRPSAAGTIQQETHMRFLLPVRPAGT